MMLVMKVMKNSNCVRLCFFTLLDAFIYFSEVYSAFYLCLSGTLLEMKSWKHSVHLMMPSEDKTQVRWSQRLTPLQYQGLVVYLGNIKSMAERKSRLTCPGSMSRTLVTGTYYWSTYRVARSRNHILSTLFLS